MADAKNAAGGWVVDPAVRCIHFIADELKMASLLTRALGVMEGAPTLYRAAGALLAKEGQQDALAVVRELLRDESTFSDWAAVERSTGFAKIHSHALVSLWSAHEVSVEDTAIAILSRDTIAANRAFASLGVQPKGPDSDQIDEQAARSICRRFYRKLRRETDAGRARSRMLSALQIDIAVGQDVLDTLVETHALRDCIVHRGGVIDERAVRQSQSLEDCRGKAIQLSREELAKHFGAIGDYTRAILAAVLRSRYLHAP